MPAMFKEQGAHAQFAAMLILEKCLHGQCIFTGDV